MLSPLVGCSVSLGAGLAVGTGPFRSFCSGSAPGRIAAYSANPRANDRELCEEADAVSVYLPNAKSRSGDGEDTAFLMVSEIHGTEEVDGVIYEDREETLIALASTQDGSFSASGQKYGVAAANTVSLTWSYTDAMLSDLKIRFNSMTARCTSLPTQSATVTKMDYSVRLETTIGTSEYLQTGTVSYPSSGTSYYKGLNSGWYAYGGNNGIAMLTVYYNNGDSATYTGSLGAKH